MTEPTAREQYSLELINRLRLDPAGAFDRMIADAPSGTAFDSGVTAALAFFFVDLDALRSQLDALTPVAPLAWNGALGDAAAAHNVAMRDADLQAHQVPGELSLGERTDAAGYDWTQLAENVFAFAQNPDHAHAGFVIDWGYDAGETASTRSGGDGIQDPAGHRIALMNGNYTEIGIDWLADSNSATQVGPWLTSQEFGRPFGNEARLLGVVYADDGDRFYDMGEGMGDVVLSVEGAGAAATGAAGGYALSVGAGRHVATFSGGGLSAPVSVEVSLTDANAKIDLRDGDWVETSVDATAVSGVTGLRALGVGDRVLRGADGEETIVGAAGDDSLFGGRGADKLRGGAGFDTMYGGGHSDAMFGGSEGDRMLGGRGWDRLYGGQGDDRLFGEAGDDELRGARGRDRLVGGDGDDRLWGGAGRDVFVFDASDGTDRIMDWSARDRIDLSGAGLDLPEIEIGTRGADAVVLAGATTILIEGAATSFDESALIL